MEILLTNTTKESVEEKDIENICKITFKKLEVKNPTVSITIVDNEKIKEINRDYRNKDSETDVRRVWSFFEKRNMLFNSSRSSSFTWI